jgi:hypothetical protein
MIIFQGERDGNVISDGTILINFYPARTSETLVSIQFYTRRPHPLIYTGNDKVKVEPSFFLLSTLIFPACPFTTIS